ncbi:tetratricopeptide repeat protein [Streptomyces sp. NPDC048442]|uniref:tetratricopeptide repeat protein n=1 Tax=Streptomyces sp. NPDC048442 TaxID=3154823 RepID=UPI00343A7377
MSGAGAWFTDRRQALAAIRAVVDGDEKVSGPAAGKVVRVLLVTGVPGTGKSTVLERTADQCPHVFGGVLDTDRLVDGMARPESGADDAALLLLRQVGVRLAQAAPWWYRPWTRRRAARIGTTSRVTVSASAFASRGGVISNSPVTANPPALSQSEHRLLWQGQLEAVARSVRRRRCVLLLDSCERLAYFDDVLSASGHDPYGLGGWFTAVLAGLLTRMPRLRVVLAATHRQPVTLTPAPAGSPTPLTIGTFPCAVHELRAWTADVTRSYLTRRGLPDTTELDRPSLPVEAAWLADILTTTALTTAPATAQAVQDLTRMPRSAWVTAHLLPRLAPDHRALLPAAVVLRTFTLGALRTVAGAGGTALDAGAGSNDDWFQRFSALSALRPVTGTDQWRLHQTVRGWLLDTYTLQDHQLPSADQILPRLHRAAAAYHQAINSGRFSAEETRHRFVLGETVTAWALALAHSLSSAPPDLPQIRLLTDLALDPETRGTLAKQQPEHLADAHLARAWLHHHTGEHADSQAHAERALNFYRTADPHHPALPATARLAGQGAWKRYRFAIAVTHWHTALTLHDDPPSDLQRAYAEAVLNTGDLPLAGTLLTDALHHNSNSAAPQAVLTGPEPSGGSDVPRTVYEALPAVPVGEDLASAAIHAHLHLLLGRTALNQSRWDRSRHHLRRARELAPDHPHIQALAHHYRAELALTHWDLDTAEHHIRHGLTAVQRCTDPRCRPPLLLSQANHFQKSAESDSAAVRDKETNSISVTRQAERTYQREVAHDLLTATLEIADSLGDLPTRANALWALAEVARRLDDYAAAEGMATAALTLYRDLGDRHGEANTLWALAEAAQMQPDHAAAEGMATAALTLYRDLGDRHGEANALWALAEGARMRGDHAAAEGMAPAALTLYRDLGDRHGEANTLWIIANEAAVRGDYGAAKEAAAAALALYRDLGHRHGEANTLRLLAGVAQMQGDYAAAVRAATAALTVYRNLGHPNGEADALRLLAEVARMRGDYATAQRSAAAALALHRGLKHRHGEANALLTLAEVALMRGDHAAAQRAAAAAVTLYHDLGDGNGEANALLTLAEAAQMQGDHAAAQRAAAAALTLYHELNHCHGEANALLTLAEVALMRGDHAAAQRAAAAALTLYHDLGDGNGEANALLPLAEAAFAQGRPDAAAGLWLLAAELYDTLGLRTQAAYCRRRAGES